MAAAANSKCPTSLGAIGEMTSVEYKDGNIVYTCTVDETYVDIDVLNENPDMMNRNIKLMFTNPSGDVKDLFEALIEAKAGVELIYIGKKSGKEASVTISSKDLEEISNPEQQKKPEAALEGQIEITNMQCPMQIATGMTMTHVSIESGYVVYNITCDETLYSISELSKNKTQLKESIIEGLNSGDPSTDMLIKLCREVKKGIAYKYIGDTSENECMIKILTSEL